MDSYKITSLNSGPFWGYHYMAVPIGCSVPKKEHDQQIFIHDCFVRGAKCSGSQLQLAKSSAGSTQQCTPRNSFEIPDDSFMIQCLVCVCVCSGPQPSTLNPQPSTLNPQPSTLNPQPSTLNPQPACNKTFGMQPAPRLSRNLLESVKTMRLTSF